MYSLLGCEPRKIGPPGHTIITCNIIWNHQLEPSDHLTKIMAKLNSPEDISRHLLKSGYSWKRNYNIKQFLSPEELVANKGGVCSAFGRFWIFALANIGIKSDLVAIYSNKSAHAIIVFRCPRTNRYRLTSNQYLYIVDLGEDRDEAIKKAADEFYSNWLAIEVYGEDGVLREVINSPNSDHYPTIEEVDFDIMV